MDVHVRSTTEGAQLSYTLSGRGEAHEFSDPDEVTAKQNGGQFTVGGTVSETHSFAVEGGHVSNFEQTGGDSDWVVVIDGDVVAFGGPGPSLTGGFEYATKPQIRSYVECMVNGFPSEEEVRSIIQTELSNVGFDDLVDEAAVRRIVRDEVENLDPGDGGDSPDGGEDPPGEGGWTPLPKEVWDNRSRTQIPDGGGALAIWSTGEGDLRYHVEGVGRADYFDDPNQSKLAGLPNNDSVLTRADGTFELEGYTGNGYGDAFLVDGYVTSFEVRDGDSPWRLESMGDVDVLVQYNGPTEGGD